MTNKTIKLPVLREEDKEKYANKEIREFKLPSNIGTLNKIPKTVKNILETDLFPEIDIDKNIKQTFIGIFTSFGKEGMEVSNFGKESFNNSLESIEKNILIPIRDIFTKNNIKNLLNRISEMEEERYLSDKEKEIKEFFENIDDFFKEFEEKTIELKKYSYSNALVHSNEAFTNKTKEFLVFINKATKGYKHFTDIFNIETTEKNKHYSGIIENVDIDKETETYSNFFKKIIKYILRK